MIALLGVISGLFAAIACAVIYHAGCEQGARLARAGMAVPDQLPTMDKIADKIIGEPPNTAEQIVREYEEEFGTMEKTEREAMIRGWNDNTEYLV